MKNKKVLMHVLNLSLPIIVEMTIYTFMMILDTMMIGNYGGNKALSAVGISTEIISSCVNIFIGVGMAIPITALVAQSVGANNKKQAEEFASSGFLIGFLISIFIFFIMFIFSKNILFIAGAKGTVLIIGNIFTKVILISALFNMLTILMNSVLRGYGNTYTPLIICIIIAIIKITLDWVLIFGHASQNYGIMGASYASVISQFVGLVICAYYILYVSKIKIKFKYMLFFRKNILKEIFKIFIPSFMDEAAFNISRLICTFIIMNIGSISFASNQIANTIESISIMPGIGFGMAATTLVGMKVGEKNYRKAKEYAYGCVFWSVLMMSIFSIIFFLGSNYLVDLFVGDSEKEVMRLAGVCLFIGGFEQPFIALSYGFAGAIEGFKDAKTPFFISFVSGWLIRIPLIVYFMYFKKSSIVTVWWITLIQWSFDGTIMFICFRKKLRKYLFPYY